MRIVRLVALLGVLALAIAACGGGELAEQVIEGQEGIEDVEIDEDDGSVNITIEGEDGDVSAVFGGGEVPDDFPVPIAPGGEVVAVMEASTGDNLTLEYPAGQFESIKDFYQSWVDSTGGETTSFEGEDLKSWSVESGDDLYNVTVADNESEIAVAIIVANQSG